MALRREGGDREAQSGSTELKCGEFKCDAESESPRRPIHEEEADGHGGEEVTRVGDEYYPSLLLRFAFISHHLSFFPIIYLSLYPIFHLFLQILEGIFPVKLVFSFRESFVSQGIFMFCLGIFYALIGVKLVLDIIIFGVLLGLLSLKQQSQKRNRAKPSPSPSPPLNSLTAASSPRLS